MSVLPFDDEAEVVARANDTPFGLAAGVMTQSLPRANRIAAALQAGIVWINSYNLTPVAMPLAARSNRASAARTGWRRSTSTLSARASMSISGASNRLTDRGR